MPSGAGLTFTLLSLIFAWLLWQDRRASEGGGEGEETPRWRLWMRSLIPPVLLAALLPSGCANERFDSGRHTEVVQQGGGPPA